MKVVASATEGLPFGGWSLSEKGGEAMDGFITYPEFVQICMLVVMLITLYQRRD